MDIPRSLDELVRDSRARIARLRRQYGNREDFDHFVRDALVELLEESGHSRETIKFTLRAMFGR